ncbi:DUF6221 family protein [Streptomyces sp. NPDC051597]|uniref:DUF6221 family protein n=1 Tax=Streptomyces sp. NPDC051597 TaxID=3155049 RepID=UPI003422799E
MDLHTWITQQVDKVEALVRAQPPAPWRYDADEEQVLAADNIRVAETFALSNRQQRAIGAHVVAHDPDAVLRRCESDRRILARHRMDPAAATSPDRATACNGCGAEWVQDSYDPFVENLNDCPELRDLAHAHGLTDDIFAGLAQPQPPAPEPRSERRLGLDDILTTRPITTSDVPAALRGPRWKP